jgi:glycosyltransferase involved in cell wall biosynthesis
MASFLPAQKAFGDSFSLDIVIPTFNRCPYDPQGPDAHLNPLVWAISSLTVQKQWIRTIVVVDDGSTDYTRSTVLALASQQNRPAILYHRLRRRHGSALARNSGAELSTARFLLFTDDDCIFARDAIRRALLTLAWLVEKDPATAALNMPYYLRSRSFRSKVPRNQIGAVDITNGLVLGNFDTYPEEYDAKDRIAVGGHCLLRPFEVANLGCTFLADRSGFIRVGGFPCDFDWVNSYGEETELAFRLREGGSHLYFTPDPQTHVVHFKYGARINSTRPRGQGFAVSIMGRKYTLNKLIEWSNAGGSSSGNRVDLAYLAYSKIYSYFVILSVRSKQGGLNWLRRAYREYVLPEGESRLTRSQRESIWRAAASDGARRVRNQTHPGRHFSAGR